jgi:pimeloyl-ACP methyl ester carboxylesterase
MFRIDLNGLSIAYELSGDGPPLILLHGFSQDSRVWRGQLEALSSTFTVFAWDAPGAGRSSDPPEDFDLADWADCLAGCTDAANLAKAHVVGLSWGGILAQEFYRSYPERVGSLILADTYAGWKGSLPADVTSERLAACLRASYLPPEDFVQRLLPSMLSPAPAGKAVEDLGRIMGDFHPAGFRLMARVCAEADTRDLLPAIDVPALLLWGEKDSRSPLYVAEAFRDAIAGARLVVIPGAGHVSNMESPEAFNATVQEFCGAIRLG